jgi:ABC-type uncharacterized transport system permease subunit
MDWLKVLQAGLKAGFFALLGVIGAVLVGALAIAVNYKPDGALPQVVMTYLVAPLIAGLMGLINNWLKHKDDK